MRNIIRWIGEESESLWKLIIGAKFGASKEGWEIKDANYRCSTLWKGILSEREEFCNYVRYWVGSGEKMNL